MLVDVEALLIAHDRGLDVTTVVVRLRDAGVERGDGREIIELLGEHERLLERRQCLLRLTLVAERVRQIHEPPVVEGDVLDRPVLARLHALAEKAHLFLVGVGARVRSREDGLDPHLLFGVVQQIGHPLRTLDHRERLLRLRGGVVCGG